MGNLRKQHDGTSLAGNQPAFLQEFQGFDDRLPTGLSLLSQLAGRDDERVFRALMGKDVLEHRVLLAAELVEQVNEIGQVGNLEAVPVDPLDHLIGDYRLACNLHLAVLLECLSINPHIGFLPSIDCLR